jgi:nicotinamidase-related amidase
MTRNTSVLKRFFLALLIFGIHGALHGGAAADTTAPAVNAITVASAVKNMQTGQADALPLTLTWETAENAAWRTNTERVSIDPGRTALIICDMWDKHWSRGATERVNELAPRINALANYLRDRGVLIIHAPSDTMSYYAGNLARIRLLLRPARETFPVLYELPRYPLPIDDSDGGSDTGEPESMVNQSVWTRQHDAIVIDETKDLIGVEGDRIRSYLKQEGRDLILIAGVHTNMCVLNRDFAIWAMLERGFNTVLLDEYTDAMYNPAMPPYVSHDEGTRLVCSYIRRYYCPTGAL